MTLSLSYYPVGLTQLRVWIHFQLAFKTMNKLGMFVCVCVYVCMCVYLHVCLCLQCGHILETLKW